MGRVRQVKFHDTDGEDLIDFFDWDGLSAFWIFYNSTYNRIELTFHSSKAPEDFSMQLNPKVAIKLYKLMNGVLSY